MARPVLIDTDPGVDDCLALLYSFNSPAFAVKAVTAVCGNSSIEYTTRNARYICALAGREDIAVDSGAAKPLKRELDRAVVHGREGLGGANVPLPAVASGDAVEAIIAAGRQYGEELIYIALGPLTNFALALESDPGVISRSGGLLMLGGAFNVPGNKNRVAEFNFFVDPEAADSVLRAAGRKILVPLDLCFQAVFQVEEFREIRSQNLLRILQPMLEQYAMGNAKEEGIPGVIMYDPLAVFCAEQIFCRAGQGITLRESDVIVETNGVHTRGMTVRENRLNAELNFNCEVAAAFDLPQFRKTFFAALCKY